MVVFSLVANDFEEPSEGAGSYLTGRGQRMSPAVEAIEDAVTEEILLHGGNSVLTWCAVNVIAEKIRLVSGSFLRKINRAD